MKSNGLPRHVAIIMDGNGRWARQRRLPRTSGHLEGIKRLEELVATAVEMGINALTVYAFSTENWQRPRGEVSMLMRVFISTLNKKIRELKKKNVKIQFIGNRDGIPQRVLQAMDAATQLTENNSGLLFSIAFNYGSRSEIVDAVKKIGLAIGNNSIKPQDIDEKVVSDALYTKGLPDPDLLIRTSGEKRISNFLLWQLSYSELYFTDALWPEFDADEFKKAIADFAQRERRYGRVSPVKK